MAVTRIDTQDIRDLTIQTGDIADTQIVPGKADLSGSSVWTFQGGLSGSIQQTQAGLSYLVGGSGVTVVSASNGQITISAPAIANAAPDDASYLVLGLDGGLSAERVLTPGTGIDAVDAGANGNYTLSIDDSVVATVSGTTFKGAVDISAGGLDISAGGLLVANDIQVTGTGSFVGGLSGSLTRLTDGSSFIEAGFGITVVSASNGAITITAPSLATAAPDSAQYLVLALDGELSAERVLTPGVGLQATDAGANGAYTIDVDDSTVATLSSSNVSFAGGIQVATNVQVTGTGSFVGGLSGSLTQLTDGSSYLIAGANITITSASNGAITITGGDSNGLVGFDDFVFGDAPTGTINGSNANFTASQVPIPNTSLRVYKNGIRMASGSSADYVMNVTDDGAFVVFQAGAIPTTDSVILFDYHLQP